MAEDMVRKTDSHPSLLLITCQDLFAKIAEATGETLESVYRMQEAERNGLVDVLNLKQEEQKEPTGEPTESENKRRRDCSGEDAGFPPKRVATPRRRSNKENV